MPSEARATTKMIAASRSVTYQRGAPGALGEGPNGTTEKMMNAGATTRQGASR